MTAIEILLHSIQNNPPDGLVSAHQDSGGVRVKQTRGGMSWLFRPRPEYAPTGTGSPQARQHARLFAELMERYSTAEARIKNARETAAGVRTNPGAHDLEDLALVRSEPRFPDCSITIDIKPAWSSEQIKARDELERRRKETERLHRLAAGPPLRRVHVYLDDDGRPDLGNVPDDIRAAVTGPVWASAMRVLQSRRVALPQEQEPAQEPAEPEQDAPVPEGEPPEPDEE